MSLQLFAFLAIGKDMCVQAPRGAGSTLSPQQREQAQTALDGQFQSLVRRCRVLLPEDHPAALCTLRAAGTTWLLGLLGQDLFATMQQAFAALRREEAGRVAGTSADWEGGTAGGGPTSSRGAAPSGAAEAAEAAASRKGQDAVLLRQLRSVLSDHLSGLARAAGTGSAAAVGGISFATWHRAVCALAAALQCTQVTGAAGQELQQGMEGEGTAPEGAAAAAAWIAGCAGLARGLSESKCQRAATTARDAYLRSMPPMYPQAQHTAGVQVLLPSSILAPGWNAHTWQCSWLAVEHKVPESRMLWRVGGMLRDGKILAVTTL